MRVCLALCLVLSLAADPSAQATGVIWGTVADGAYGDRLPGASVRIEGTTRGAAADVDGRYRIEGVPLGDVTIRASFVGYESVAVDTVLVADSLRLDFLLPPSSWCLDEVGLSVISYPPGEVYDLPGVDVRYDSRLGRHSRPVETVSPEPVGARSSRTAAWGRGADRLGRWRPTVRGLGRPRVYVDGLPALSLDAVPVEATALAGAFAGYLPARYGGSAAGAVVAETASSRTRQAFVGAAGEGPNVALRGGARFRERLDPRACYSLIERTSLTAEGALAAGQGPVRADGRAFLEEIWRPAGLTAHARADAVTTAFGDGGSVGGVADVRAHGHLDPALLTVGADHAWGPEGPSTLVAGRAEVTWQSWSWPSAGDVQVGVEASALSGPTELGTPAVSAVAAYGERRFRVDRARWRRDVQITTGLRVERFGLVDRDVWTVQPRVHVERAYDDESAYLYGVVLSAPGADGTLWRRTEAGAGARNEVLGGRHSVWLTVGAHGYVRSVAGALRGEVVGLDAEAVFGARRVGSTLTLRSRTEWGDAALARSRHTAALTIDVSEYGRLWPLAGRHRAFVDVAEGVGGLTVVEVGGESTPWWLGDVARWLRRDEGAVSLHGRGVVVGRGAVPCADGLGVVACPAPLAEVALRVAL